MMHDSEDPSLTMIANAQKELAAMGYTWVETKITEEEVDAELRKKHPALQDAWEQYQMVKKLVQE